MAISADDIQLSMVEEDTYGVTPASPVFQIIPLTGEGVVAEVTTQISNLMTPSRQVQDLITTGITAAGDISTEFAVTPSMRMLLASAMAERWVPITPDIPGKPVDLSETMIGSQQLSFTLEKRWPDPLNDGQYLYQRVTGCVVNTASFSVSPDEPATISFGIIGQEMLTDDTLLTNATYAESNPVVLRGPDTVTLTIKSHTVDVNCFGEYSWDLNNNYRGILCLGHLGNKEMALGRAEITSAMRVYFSSNALLDTLLAQGATTVAFEIQTDADPSNYFATHMPRVKFSQDNVVAGGSGESVVDDIVVQALFNSSGTDDTLGDNKADKTSMRIVIGVGTPAVLINTSE